MTCTFAHDDGAYVLGALSPADRLEFERHLPGCADCTRAVGELAGLPGLLGRVDAAMLEQPDLDEPVPATLLPRLSLEVRRARRRRTWLAAGLTAAAAAAVAVVAVVAADQATGDRPVTPALPSASSTESGPTPEPLAMTPVGEVPVHATVTLEQVTWGTRLGLTCTYDAESVEYELPPEVDYTLFVRTKDGEVEQVGSWRSVDGQAMSLTAGTAASPDELASVEVRTLDGRVVLELTT